MIIIFIIIMTTIITIIIFIIIIIIIIIIIFIIIIITIIIISVGKPFVGNLHRPFPHLIGMRPFKRKAQKQNHEGLGPERTILYQCGWG